MNSKPRSWPFWLLIIVVYMILPLIGLGISFVKFMAWWRVAFGDLS